MNKLTNQAEVTGLYNNLETIVQSNENTTFLIDELKITKTANKELWATGNLTFNIIVENKSSANIENITITDILNPALISLIVESVRINNIPAGYGIYTYDLESGALIFNLPTVGPSQTLIIRFQVRKKATEIFKLDNFATLSLNNNITIKANNDDNTTSNIITIYGISSVCRCKEVKRNITTENRNP